jgi:restriction endonuclease Mrr
MADIEIYQYPPELFSLLVDTIPLLARSKKDVLTFFRGAGMTPTMMIDIEEQFATDKASLNKYDMTRRLLSTLNEAGDRALTARRELLKRVVQFEDFTRCWEKDVLPAKGLVAEIQRVVQVKDSFTRMAHARDQEVQARHAERQEGLSAALDASRARREKIAAAKSKLFALFSETDAQKRGKDLEAALNALFDAYGVLIAEDFRRKGGGDSGVVEQIDGVVEVAGQLYLVEMKWWASNLGAAELSPHVSRLMMRSGVAGIFISNSDYTPSAIELANDVLQQRVLVLCTLREIVLLLERDGDLLEFLAAKVRAAKLNRMAFREIAG